MTIERRIAFGVFASWLSRIAAIITGLIVIPIFFRFMGKEELGLWFMLGQSMAWISLLDLGISPAFSRRIALTRGELNNNTTEDSTTHVIYNYMATAKRIYNTIPFLAFIIVYILGNIYISSLDFKDLDKNYVLIAWFLICISHVGNVWASYWLSVIEGFGYVGWSSLILTITHIIILGVQITSILLGGGLISLAVVSICGFIVLRLFGYMFFLSREANYVKRIGKFNKQYYRVLTRPAFKIWLTSLGAFLILRTDYYFIAYYLDIKYVPSYYAAYQLINILSSLAIAIGGASSVFISEMWVNNKYTDIHKIVIRNLRLSLLIMAIGISFVITNGENIIDIWLGPGNFIGYPILIIFCIMLTLETQHVIIAYAVRATEHEVFVKSALLSGLFNVLFTFYFVQKYGLIGVAAATLLAQLITNNWYVIYVGTRRLNMNGKTMFIKGYLPPIIIFLVSAIIMLILQNNLTQIVGKNINLLISIAVIAVIFITSVWGVVLNNNEKKQIKNYLIKSLT